MSAATVAELLHAGYGDRTIARQAGVTIASVTRLRADLGLPKARGGTKKAASLEDLFWRRTRDAGDGHLEWGGHRDRKGTATLHWGQTMHSALRVAYRIANGADPDGYAHTPCGYDGCIAPAHTADSARTPRRGHHRAGGQRAAVSREEIIRLLHDGHSDKEIGRRLHTDPQRAGRIRAELGLPSCANKTISFEQRWAAHAEPVDGGHIRWTGRLRDGTAPAVLHNGRDTSVRRIVFERLHGRPATGPVRPGCGYGPCIRPEHLEDQPMRAQLDQQYEAIFGDLAA